jgi:hypothetical protein
MPRTPSPLHPAAPAPSPGCRRFRGTLLLPVILLLLSACASISGDPTGPSGSVTFEQVAEITVGSEPLGVAVAGDFYAVANHINSTAGEPNSLMLIHADSLRVSAAIDITGNPKDLLWVPEVSLLYLTDEGSRIIRGFTVPGLSMPVTVAPPGVGTSSFPAGIAYDPAGGGRIITAEMYSGLVFRFDAATGAPLDTVSYRNPRGPGGWSYESGPSVAVDAVHNRLMVGNLDEQRIEVFTLDSLQRLSGVSHVETLEFLPNFVLADPVNGLFYTNERSASSFASIVQRFNTATLDALPPVAIYFYPEWGGSTGLWKGCG